MMMMMNSKLCSNIFYEWSLIDGLTNGNEKQLSYKKNKNKQNKKKQ